MSNFKKSKEKYDVVVVGAGLSGLLTAAILTRKGKKVLILEGQEVIGGYSRGVNTPYGLINNGLKFLPYLEGESSTIIEMLNQLIVGGVDFSIVDNAPQTYEGGGFKSFLGFGNKAPEFYDELAYFLTPQRLKLNPDISKVINSLVACIGETFIQTKNYVTQFQIHEGKVASIVVNNTKLIEAQEYIFTAHPLELINKISDDWLSIKAKAKIQKADYWTPVCLDIVHQGCISNSERLHLLNGTTQDELGPCVGLFHEYNEEQNTQLSQWVTFIDRESSEDPELIGPVLKKVKRQIKRAYPMALDVVKYERILVAPYTAGKVDLKFNSNGSLFNIKNLWLTSGLCQGQGNLMGALKKSIQVSNSILSANPTAQIADLQAEI